MLRAAAVAVAFATLAGPPRAGLFVPGTSLGGVRLGMTPAQVERLWGRDHGRCRGCPEPTWYFNYRPFTPEGAGVAFARGRVVAVFTLWSPRGWRTSAGLRIGDVEARVTQLYGALVSVRCGSYSAYTFRRNGAVNVIYVLGGKVWGFGLSRPGRTRLCR